MKKCLYTIVSKDPITNPRRWIVDEFGLAYIKKHYTEYESHGETFNRWVEFNVNKIRDGINFDFGGMIDKDEPTVIFRWRGNVCSIPLTHIDVLKCALCDIHTIRPSGGWCVRIWMWKWYLSNETRLDLLKVTNRLLQNNKVKMEEYHATFMAKMKKFRDQGIVA